MADSKHQIFQVGLLSFNLATQIFFLKIYLFIYLFSGEGFFHIDSSDEVSPEV